MGPFFHYFHPNFFFKCSMFQEISLKMGTFQNDPSKTGVRGSSSTPPVKTKSEYPQQSMSCLPIKSSVSESFWMGWFNVGANCLGVLKFGFGRDKSVSRTKKLQLIQLVWALQEFSPRNCKLVRFRFSCASGGLSRLWRSFFIGSIA